MADTTEATTVHTVEVVRYAGSAFGCGGYPSVLRATMTAGEVNVLRGCWSRSFLAGDDELLLLALPLASCDFGVERVEALLERVAQNNESQEPLLGVVDRGRFYGVNSALAVRTHNDKASLSQDLEML